MRTFLDIKDDIVDCLDNVEAALHYLEETGEYESFELDECSDNLESTAQLLKLILRRGY